MKSYRNFDGVYGNVSTLRFVRSLGESRLITFEGDRRRGRNRVGETLTLVLNHDLYKLFNHVSSGTVIEI